MTIEKRVLVELTDTDTNTVTCERQLVEYNPDTVPYFMDTVTEDPYSSHMTRSGIRNYATVSQFENGGDVAGSHPLVDYHGDNPFFNGDSTASTFTNWDLNDLHGSYGGYEERLGILQIPKVFHGDENKPITSLELIDTDTGTSKQKAGVLFSQDSSGNFILEKDELALVVSERGSYTIHPSQLGKYVYTKAYMDDVGGASTADFKLRIKYDNNGTEVTIIEPITSYLQHPMSSPTKGVTYAQRRINFEPQTGAHTEINGDLVSADEISLSHRLQQVEMLTTMIDGDLHVAGNTASVINLSGGSGTYVAVDWSGTGNNWETGLTKTLPPNSYQLNPIVKDDNDLISKVLGWKCFVSADEDVYNINIASGSTNATEYVGVGGWAVQGSGSGTFVGNVFNNAVTNRGGNAYTSQWYSGLIAYLDTGTNTDGWVEYKSPATAQVAGDVMAFGAILYNQRQGIAGDTLSEPLITVTDDVTGNVLLTSRIDTTAYPNLTAGNMTQNWTSFLTTRDTYVATGNAVTIKFHMDDTGAADSTAGYYGVKDARMFKDADLGSPVTGAYLKRESASYIRWNKMSGSLVLDEIELAKDGKLIPQFNITKGGIQASDKVTISYTKNGGTPVEILDIEGNWEIANEIYTTPYIWNEGVDGVVGDKFIFTIKLDIDTAVSQWLRINASHTLVKLKLD